MDGVHQIKVEYNLENKSASDPVENITTDPIGGTATDPVDNTTTDPVDNTTTDPVDNTTTDPVDNTTTDPADNTTTDPIDNTITNEVIDNNSTSESFNHDLIVNAKGTIGSGKFAHFTVLVDGKEIGNVYTTSSFEPYKFTLPKDPKDIGEIHIVFDNDATGRDLYVESIELNGRQIQGTSKDATYQKTDGSIVNFTGKMPWNGSLIFDISDPVDNTSPTDPLIGPSSTDPVVEIGNDTPTIDVTWDPVMEASPDASKIFVEYETSDFHEPLVPSNVFSGITSLDNKAYFIYCDSNRRPIIGKIEENTTEIAFLDDPEYIVKKEDPHHIFSIGIDTDGFIHVAGDMHGYPGYQYNPDLPDRYKNKNILYWVSDNPHDISSFSFKGGDQTSALPSKGYSYLSFLSDKNNNLYARYRCVIDDHGNGFHVGNYSFGMARYNVSTKSWSQLGEIPPHTFKGHTAVRKAIFWAEAGPYQGYLGDAFFDVNNRLHVVASMRDTQDETQLHNYVVYAYSDDDGKTFRRMDGSSITLPIGTNPGPSQGEIVEDPKSSPVGLYDTFAHVGSDVLGNPIVGYAVYSNTSGARKEYCKYWNGKQWSSRIEWPAGGTSANRQLVGPDGMLLFFNIKKDGMIVRTPNIDSPGEVHYMNGRFQSFDRNALRDKNLLRGFLLSDGKIKIVSMQF